MASKTRSVLVVYDGEDAEPWKDYIFEALHTNSFLFSLEAVTCANLDHNDLTSYSVLTLLLSPNMLSTLVEKAKDLCAVLMAQPCVAVILLATSVEELHTDIEPLYLGSDAWRVFDMPTEGDSSKITIMFANLVNFLEAETAKSEKKSHRSRQNKIETVCPDCVRKKDEKVVVVFKEEIKGEVTVTIGTNSDVKVTKCNPYNITFRAPAHPAGKARLEIRENGKVIHQQTVSYKIPSFSNLDFVAECLNIDPQNKQELDTKLVDIYNESIPGDYCLERMIKPETLSTLSEAGEVRSSKLKFPTLLHLAAYHGLSQLAAAILDTPGSTAAYDIVNKDGHKPADMSRKHHHEDLAQYMEEFMDTKTMVDLYLTMYQREYYNKTNPHGIEGYSDMGRGTGLQEDYIQTRRGRDYVEESRSDEEDAAVPTQNTRLSSSGSGRKHKPPAVPHKLRTIDRREDSTEDIKPPPRAPKTWKLKTPSASEANDQPPEEMAPEPPTNEKPFPSPLSPAQFMNMEESPYKTTELSPCALGSRCIAELQEIQEDYKAGEFTIEQVEMLFASWKERFDTRKTSSIRERQEQLQKLRENHRTVLEKGDKKKKGKGKFAWSKSKKSEPALDIQHLGNTYSTLPRGSRISSNRDSTLSTSSTSSSSSCGSFVGSENRDSGIPATIQEFDSDSETNSASSMRRKRQGESYREQRSNSQIFQEEFKPPPRPPPPVTRNKPAPRVPPRKS